MALLEQQHAGSEKGLLRPDGHEHNADGRSLANYTLADLRSIRQVPKNKNDAELLGTLVLAENSTVSSESSVGGNLSVPGDISPNWPHDFDNIIDRAQNGKRQSRYDKDSRKASVRINDQDGGWHETQYDPESGEPTGKTDHQVHPDGSTSDHERDAQGRKVRDRDTDASGNWDEKRYDPESGVEVEHTHHQQNADGSSTDTTEGMGYKLVRNTDANGNYTEEYLDAQGNPTGERSEHKKNADGSTDDTEQDGEGGTLHRHTDAQGNYTERVLDDNQKDENGNPKEVSRKVHHQNEDGSSDDTEYENGKKGSYTRTNKDGSFTITRYNPDTGAVLGTVSYDWQGKEIDPS